MVALVIAVVVPTAILTIAAALRFSRLTRCFSGAIIIARGGSTITGRGTVRTARGT